MRWLVVVAFCVSATAIPRPHIEAVLPHHGDTYTERQGVITTAPVDFFARGIAWHKSGSVMMREALTLINARLTLYFAEGWLEKAPGLADHDPRIGVIALEGGGVNFSKTEGLYSARTFTPMRPPGSHSRFFAIYRNPVEMAVSELAYDMEEYNTELYEHQRLTYEDTARCHRDDGGDDAFLRPFCDGLRDVLVASDTYLKGVLPPPDKDTCETATAETGDSNRGQHSVRPCITGHLARHSAHAPARVPARRGAMLTLLTPSAATGSEYLHRLLDGGQEDEALLASAIFMLAVSIRGGAQLATFQRIEQPDSARSCEADYHDASVSECEAVWRSMLGALVDWTNTTGYRPSIAGVQVVAGAGTFGAASGPLAGFGQLMDEIVGIAATTCPAVASFAVGSHSAVNASNTTQPEDRFARLSRLDAEYLNNTLAEMTAITACNASVRYEPESMK